MNPKLIFEKISLQSNIYGYAAVMYKDDELMAKRFLFELKEQIDNNPIDSEQVFVPDLVKQIKDFCNCYCQ